MKLSIFMADAGVLRFGATIAFVVALNFTGLLIIFFITTSMAEQ